MTYLKYIWYFIRWCCRLQSTCTDTGHGTDSNL